MSDFTDKFTDTRGQYQWVKGYYTGAKADSVMAHANKGIGYIILESSTGAGKSVLVAFRCLVGELPDNVSACGNYDAAQFEKMLSTRSGIHI